MTLVLLDNCSLLNLFAAWGNLAQLKACGGQWHVCDAVVAEAHYVMEDDGKGKLVKQPIDITKEVAAGNLSRCSPESDAESDLTVSLAATVDDGEAMSIAIAKVRGWTVVTDDQKAQEVAKGLGVAVVDTYEVIQLWAQKSRADAAAIQAMVRRITRLARFIPPKKSPHHDWWIAQLK